MGDGTETVLVVDDEQRLADLFVTWLREDRDVKVAYDGEEALDKFDDSIGTVLLDRRMPGLSGDDVLREIRDRDASARVVMVTAVDPDFDIIEMGFDDYVVKPISKDDLLEIVEKMEARAEYDQNIQQYYSLASKKGLLEAEKPASELEDNEEYRQLVEEFESLKAEVDGAVEELSTHEDFASAFRGLTPEEDGPDPGSG
ncbi:MAG: HalX domain-containing protein [Halobacteriales archaeon]